MFSRYFQSELTYLRELGRAFSARHPALAGAFAERGGDPDVERLLEGFAFLTARIRERIDDAVPEVVDALAEMLVPQAVRPVPACTIVEFAANPASRASTHTIAAGTELGARPHEGEKARFRTCWDIELLPVTVEQTRIDDSEASRPVVCVTLRLHGPTAAEALARGGLVLYVHGQLGQACSLFQWLAAHLTGVSYRTDGEDPVALPEAVVRPAALGPDRPLLPWPDNAPDGIRLLLEAFTLPERMLFVEVGGLEGLAAVTAETLELRFTVADAPPLPKRLAPDALRAHCVPAVNLFEADAEPIPLAAGGQEHLLRPVGVDARHAEVYSVDSVVGVLGRGRARREYAPFHAFAHLARPPEEMAYYTLRRAHSPLDGRFDTYLALQTPLDIAPQHDDDTVLSVSMTCTHRDLPNQLRAGDVSVPLPGSPGIATFQNVTAVSPPVRPRVGHERRWRLIAHLASNVASIAELDSLKRLLHYYVAEGSGDDPRLRRNTRQVDGIRKVESKPAHAVIRGAACRGFHTTVQLDEAAFGSPGEAYVFACALERLFRTETPINAFHRLSLELHPSGRKVQWEPRFGTDSVF